MRAARIIAVFGACLSLAKAQSDLPAERTLRFQHIQSTKGRGEVATGIQILTYIPDIREDTSGSALNVRGSAHELDLAQWLFGEFDRPPSAGTLERRTPATYVVAGNDNDVVRLSFVPKTTSVQDFQEIATAVRSLLEIRRVFTYDDDRVLALRGSAQQATISSQLLDILAETKGVEHSASSPITMPGDGNENVICVFRVSSADSVDAFQEMAVLVRSLGEIRRVFTYNRARAILVRGTPSQMELARWLFDQLDKPNSGSEGSELYRIPGEFEGDVRIFYLKKTRTVAEFQSAVADIRKAANIQRAFTYNATRAVAVRGTEAQLGEAERTIKTRGM